MGHEVLDETALPALPPPAAEVGPPPPLLPERSDFLEGDAPAAEKVEAFLAKAFEATGSEAQSAAAGALVPWICDVLLSNHSVKAYGRDLMDFVRHMQAQGVDPLHVTADHVKCYKRAPRGRPEVRDGGQAAFGLTRHVPSTCRQGAHRVGDGAGHRRRQGPGRPEELDAVIDRAAGDLAPGGDPDRDLAGDKGSRVDECLLHHRLPGVRGGGSVRRAPRDRRGRALSPRHREAKQEAERDPARRGAPRCGRISIVRGSGMIKEGPLFRPMKPDGSGLASPAT